MNRSFVSSVGPRAGSRPSCWRRLLAATVLALIGAGCAGLLEAAGLPITRSLPGSDSAPLAQPVASATPPQQHEKSGFALLVNGCDALATRLALICRPSTSLNLQACRFEDDRNGRQIAESRGAGHSSSRNEYLV